MTWADRKLREVNGAVAPTGKLALANNFRDKMQLATIKFQVATATLVFRCPQVLSLQTSSIFKPYIYEDLKVHYTLTNIGRQALQGNEGTSKGRVARKQSSHWRSGQPLCFAKGTLINLLDFKNGIGWKWITWQGKEFGVGLRGAGFLITTHNLGNNFYQTTKGRRVGRHLQKG